MHQVHIKRDSWPLTLLSAVFETEYETIHTVPSDIEASIAFVFRHLNEQQKYVLFARYQSAKSCREISAALSLSDTRVQQIEKQALALLKSPELRQYLLFGQKGVKKQKQERIRRSKGEDQAKWKERRERLAELVGTENAIVITNYELRVGTILISSLKLPQRAYKSLLSKNITTLIELCQMTDYEIFALPRVGAKTRSEILKVIAELGLTLKENDRPEFTYLL